VIPSDVQLEEYMKEKQSIMDIIAESNKSVTTGIDEKDIKHWVKIYVMGKAYRVPAGLTIMQAMEFAGYRFIRSSGCRAGFCGACATIYRKVRDYKLHAVMACQTRVEDGMFLVQIPFAPADKAIYNINKENYNVGTLFKYYPELARCLSCNTCTKSCPQDLEVMDYIQDAIKGDFKAVAEESFDCIQCGLCAVRCPAELVQYHIAQLSRRMYGRYGTKEPEQLVARIKEIEKGEYENDWNTLLKATTKELEKMYAEREREPD
jgi:ferredoxin